jgi:hypothetical protein
VPRAVLDTNVLVSALITPLGASARLLVELRAGAFEVVVSPMLLAELRDVLARGKFRSYVTAAEADAYVELIRQESVVVDDHGPSAQSAVADPDDAYLVDLALAARVDALVSGDKRLLDLRSEVRVMTPAEFLTSIGDV